MTEKGLNLKKFSKASSKLKKGQLLDIKGGYSRIPGAEESNGIVNWDGIDVRSHGDFLLDRGDAAFAIRLKARN